MNFFPSYGGHSCRPATDQFWPCFLAMVVAGRTTYCRHRQWGRQSPLFLQEDVLVEVPHHSVDDVGTEDGGRDRGSDLRYRNCSVQLGYRCPSTGMPSRMWMKLYLWLVGWEWTPSMQMVS
jgi:hypothetical protein